MDAIEWKQRRHFFLRIPGTPMETGSTTTSRRRRFSFFFVWFCLVFFSDAPGFHFGDERKTKKNKQTNKQTTRARPHVD